MDTRGQWVTVAAVRAIHIWIHVARGVTVAAVLPIHIWIHALAIGRISNTVISIGLLNTCAARCIIGQFARRHHAIPCVMGVPG
jgi:hypothetical protein